MFDALMVYAGQRQNRRDYDNMAAGALEIVKDNARFADILSYSVGGDESLHIKRQGYCHVPGLSFQDRREFGKITFKCNESRR